MKKQISIAAIFCLSILLWGCPYESKVPIDNPSVKINLKMLGTWQNQSKPEEIFKITKQDEFTYNIQVTNKNKVEVDKMLAYESVVNGITFINLWDNKPYSSSKKYNFFKIEMNGENEIETASITENVQEHFSSSNELKKFIAANMMNSYFFEKSGTLIRIRK